MLKLKVPSFTLKESLQKNIDVSGKNSAIKIKTKDNCIIIFCISEFNTQYIYTKTEGAEIEEEGAVCIDGYKLLGILKTLNQVIEIYETDKFLSIKSETGTYRFRKLDNQIEFIWPKNFNDYSSNKIQINIPLFCRLLGEILFTVPADELKADLQSIKIKIDKNKIIFTATDGQTLAFNVLEIEPHTIETGKTIVLYIDSVNSIIKLFKNITELTDIIFGSDWICLDCNFIKYFFSESTFNYPNINSILDSIKPIDFFETNFNLLKESINRTILYIKQEKRISDKSLIIKVDNNNISLNIEEVYEEKLIIEEPFNKQIEIWIDPWKLNEILKHFKTDSNIKIGINKDKTCLNFSDKDNSNLDIYLMVRRKNE